MLPGESHAVLPRRRLDDLVARELEDVADQLHVLRVVLDHEDALAAHDITSPGVGFGPACEHADGLERPEQGVTAHGLDEVRRGSESRSARMLVDDRDDDDRDVPGGGIGLECLQDGPAVHAREPDVEEDHRGPDPAHGLQPGRAVPGGRDPEGTAGEVRGEEVQRRPVVIDHDRIGLLCRRAGLGDPAGRARSLHREREPERAAHPDLGLQPHPPAQQLHDAPGQGEAQAGALLARRSTATLLERLEDPLAVRRRNPDARVRDRDRHDVSARTASPGRRPTPRRR